MATEKQPRSSGVVRAEAEIAELTAISVLGAEAIATELRAGPDIGKGDDAKRRDLIAAVRGGQHVELEVVAVVFRQKDGVQNRKGVRVSTDALDALAASFVGMPVLVDHDQGTQAARIGTILTSELSTHGGTGWSSIVQRLRIVKPDAVISVLDGTIDRWSVGMLPGDGEVICSLHRTPIFSSCNCWRLDDVEFDGKMATVEWEFTKPEGVETSSVNVPAVKGTKVDDVRQALALAIDIPERNTQPALSMNFIRLMAALSLTSLANTADEDRAVHAIEDLRRARLAAEQERDTARAERDTLRAERDTALAAGETARLAAEGTRVDALLEGAYRAGKLVYGRDGETSAALASPREARFRKIAKDHGVAALEAELAETPIVVPIGSKPIDPKDPTPREPTLAAVDIGDAQLDAQLQETAKKTGQDINVLRAEAARIRQRRGI